MRRSTDKEGFIEAQKGQKPIRLSAKEDG